MAIIETSELRKSFKTRYGVVEAVRGVDMRVDDGEIFGFLGPNGAGKTTILRILTTLLLPSAGQARVAGCDVQREPARVRERIGYVSQSGGVDSKEALRLYVSRGDTTLPAIMQLCATAGVTISSIALAHPTLDDVFLRLTGRSLRDEGHEERQAAGYAWKAKAAASGKQRAGTK